MTYLEELEAMVRGFASPAGWHACVSVVAPLPRTARKAMLVLGKESTAGGAVHISGAAQQLRRPDAAGLDELQDARGEALPGDRGLVDVEPDAREAQGALRPLPFDAARHPILSEELKHLYTAVRSACTPELIAQHIQWC
jgi:hypothetical protein